MRPSLRQRSRVVPSRDGPFKPGINNKTSAALICFFGAAAAARGQNVVMSPAPTYSVTPPAVQAELGPEIPINPILPGPSDLFQWGPVAVRPHAFYQFLYGTGLESGPGQQHASVVQTFSPGLLLNIGSHWTLDYTPSLTYYSSSQFHDTVNHAASLNWGSYYGDWSFGFSQTISIADSPLVQTAQQTATQSYSTSVDASYRFNGTMSLDMSISQSILNSSEQFNNSDSWSTMEWFNYQFFPQLDGGIGVGYGYDDVSLGPNMEHEEAQARATWRVASKLNLNVHAGMEDVEYIRGGVPNTISPIYGAAIQYRPFEHTSISLSADREVTPSLFASQAAKNSTLSMSINQQLLKHFSIGVAGSYVTSDYIASSEFVTAGRSDRYYSISTQVSCVFLKRASASVSYQYSANISNTQGFGFSSSQVGLNLGYAF